jgi:hypothetical protein
MLLSLTLFAAFYAPQTADATQPPSTAHLRYTAIGHGVQIYHCGLQDGTLQWIFDPTTEQPIGTHAAGPVWTWNDGSVITGKVLQKQPSPEPAAIPWLLLETHASGDITGALTGITLVRRSNTHAGVAPAAGCGAQTQGNLLRVPYEATYTFYSTN